MAGGFLALLVVTYSHICFSGPSSGPRGPPSPAAGMLPYRRATNGAPHGFGGGLMPVYYPRGTARLVSCYALFK